MLWTFSLSDSIPIRLLKVLCRHFEETPHHIIGSSVRFLSKIVKRSHLKTLFLMKGSINQTIKTVFFFHIQEPTSPYPSIIIADDSFHVYVDYHRITETNSPDNVLALVLSMFSIFELSFAKNARVFRFLYAIIFGAKRYLSNVMRKIMQEKSIDIYQPKDAIMSSGFSSASKWLYFLIIRIQYALTLASSVRPITPTTVSTNVIVSPGSTRKSSSPVNIEKVKYVSSDRNHG